MEKELIRLPIAASLKETQAGRKQRQKCPFVYILLTEDALEVQIVNSFTAYRWILTNQLQQWIVSEETNLDLIGKIWAELAPLKTGVGLFMLEILELMTTWKRF